MCAWVARYLRSRDPAGERLPTNIVDPTDIARREAAASGTLNLASRSLDRIPDAVLSDEALWAETVACDLSNNNLAHFPPGLAAFRRLQQLKLDRNQLSALHPSLGGMTLTDLSAARNRLTSPGVNRCVCVCVGGMHA